MTKWSAPRSGSQGPLAGSVEIFPEHDEEGPRLVAADALVGDVLDGDFGEGDARHVVVDDLDARCEQAVEARAGWRGPESVQEGLELWVHILDRGCERVRTRVIELQRVFRVGNNAHVLD